LSIILIDDKLGLENNTLSNQKNTKDH